MLHALSFKSLTVMASRRLFSSLYRSPSKFPISNPNPRLSPPLPHRPSPFGYHHFTDAAQLNTASRITTNSEVSALLGRIPSAVRYHPTVATDLGWLQGSIRTFKTNSITSVQTTNVPSFQRIVSSRIKVADLLNPYQRGTIGLFRRDGAGKNCAYYASQPGGSGSGGFKKQRKGRMHGIACTGNRVSFGRYALQVLEPAWISARQIEAGRRAMTRHARGGGKIWVRVIPDKPVSEKPTEVRMGKGKGAVSYYVAVVKPGRVLYEVGGVAENVARKAITMAGSKMPVKTKFIVADGNVETKGSLDKRKAKRLIMEESLKRLQE